VSFSIVLPGPSAGVKGQSHKAPLPTAHKTSIVGRNREGFSPISAVPAQNWCRSLKFKAACRLSRQIVPKIKKIG
jgi:hypothetical protein